MDSSLFLHKKISILRKSAFFFAFLLFWKFSTFLFKIIFFCAEGTRRSSRSTTITTTRRSSSRKDAGYTLTLDEVQVSSSRENGFGLSTQPRIYGASKQDDKRGLHTMPVKRRHNDWPRVVVRFKIVYHRIKIVQIFMSIGKVEETINTHSIYVSTR